MAAMRVTRRIFRENASLFMALRRVVDLLIPFLSGYVAYVIRVGEFQITVEYLYVLIIASLASSIVFPLFSLYQIVRGTHFGVEFRQLTLAWFCLVSALAVLAFVTQKGDFYSRKWFMIWLLLGWASLAIYRFVLRNFQRWIRQRGYNICRVVIVGAGELGQQVASHLCDIQWAGFKVVGFFDDNAKLHDRVFSEAKVEGDLEQVLKYLESAKVNELWFALPLRAERRMKEVLKAIRHQSIEVRFVPDIWGFDLLNQSVTEVAGLPVVNLSSTPMAGLNQVVKFVEDKIFAVIFLLFASPLMALIAVGIKLSSPGPVFFKQKRHGWNGETIQVWKFRTMIVHAESQGTVTQATKGDSRITRLGRFLRGTSLDELPQFFNVLSGHMSVVGPRPHAIEHNEIYKELVPQYMQRHRVKPGITGWAQINGWRGETDTLDKMQKRVEFDLFYIQNWSVLFDIRIMLLTFYKGFINRELLPGKSKKSTPGGCEDQAFPEAVDQRPEAMPDPQLIENLKTEMKQAVSAGNPDVLAQHLPELEGNLPPALGYYFKGVLSGFREDYGGALEYHMKALSQLVSVTHEDDRHYVQIQATCAAASSKCRLKDDFEGAISLLSNLLMSSVLSRDEDSRLQVVFRLAAAYYMNEQYCSVIEHLEPELHVAPASNHGFLSWAFLLVALAKAQQGDSTLVKELFQQALAHYMQLTPDNSRHFDSAGTGLEWIPLTLELQEMSPILDQCLPEFMQQYKNVLNMYQNLVKEKSLPLKDTIEAILTLSENLGSLPDPKSNLEQLSE